MSLGLNHQIVIGSRHRGDQRRGALSELAVNLLHPPALLEDHGKQDGDTHHHHHTLQDVGPHDRSKSSIGRVKDHRDCKDDQPCTVTPIGRKVECLLDDQGSRLELSNQIANGEENNGSGRKQSQSRRFVAVAKHIGNGDGSRLASKLVQPFAQDPHAANPGDHIACNPEGQYPPVAVNQGGEPGEAPAGSRRGRKGKGQGPAPQTPAP